jgi:hypothetical protein
MGIRVKQPVKENVKDTEGISYVILPVTRSYHFTMLSVNQHIDRVERHLVQRNIQDARYCYKLMKKTAGSNI